MFSTKMTATALIATLAITPGVPVAADAGDFVAGAIIGGIAGAAIQKDQQRRRAASAPRTTTRTVYRQGIPSTQEGRQIQTSLNYFGFNAGAVDGQLGQRSINAIANYQAYLGYPATGQLTPFEYNLLTTSYNRAQAGGYQTNQLIASNPEGARGLLKSYRAELAGQPAQPVTPTETMVATPAPAPQQPATTPAAAAPSPAPVATAAASALPNFFDTGSQASLASFCNTVSLVTNTNGGFTTVSSMTDPTVALNEQFCLARTYAISRSEELISQVNGFTPQQVAAQCEGFGPAVKDFVAALSLKPRDAVVQDVSSFILGTGMSPAQLAGTARICLGVGYRTDNMDVALGSALVLYALGEGVYGELMGHHLAMGFGTARRVDAAASWYEAGLAAADAGADAVFVPGQPERTELIRRASAQVSGSSTALPAATQVQPVSTGGMPSFTISK